MNPGLLRLAMGLPFAGAGGVLGAITAPHGNRVAGAARGAGIGYMTGTGLGFGAQLGEMAAPNSTPQDALPYSVAGGLGGAALGLGVGSMLQGDPEWEKKRKFREELLSLLQEEHAKLRHELKGHPPEELQKTGADEEVPALVQFARDHPESTVVPLSSILGASLNKKPKKPVSSFIRGGVLGAGTGASALLGRAAGQQITPDSLTGPVTGGIGGGLLGYLALQNLLPKDDDDDKKEKHAVSNPALRGLLEAKRMSDKSEYHGKHKRLRSLLEQYPDDFYIDSVDGNIAGITHRPSGFKIHAPLRVLPSNLRSSINDTMQGGMADAALPAA